MIELAIGIGATSIIGAVAWTGRRLILKLDRMDVVIRGDGNGVLGLGEQIRDVHGDVKSVGKALDAHISNPAAHLEAM